MSLSTRGTDDQTWGKDRGWRVSRPHMHLNESGTQQSKAVNPDARLTKKGSRSGTIDIPVMSSSVCGWGRVGDRNHLPGSLCKHFQAAWLKPGQSDVTAPPRPPPFAEHIHFLVAGHHAERASWLQTFNPAAAYWKYLYSQNQMADSAKRRINHTKPRGQKWGQFCYNNKIRAHKNMKKWLTHENLYMMYSNHWVICDIMVPESARNCKLPHAPLLHKSAHSQRPRQRGAETCGMRTV